MTEAEIEKKWENTPWDTDIYLDDIDDWGVCKDCALKDNCAEYKLNKRQCEDYERHKEVLTNEEWLRTCTTEQLAEYILNVWLDGALNVNAEFGLNEAQIESHEKYIVDWLKQPRQTKE